MRGEEGVVDQQDLLNEAVCALMPRPAALSFATSAAIHNDLPCLGSQSWKAAWVVTPESGWEESMKGWHRLAQQPSQWTTAVAVLKMSPRKLAERTQVIGFDFEAAMGLDEVGEV
jgi:hypothetical protein